MMEAVAEFRLSTNLVGEDAADGIWTDLVLHIFSFVLKLSCLVNGVVFNLAVFIYDEALVP